MNIRKTGLAILFLIVIGLGYAFVQYFYLPKWGDTFSNISKLEEDKSMLGQAKAQSADFSNLKEETVALSTRAANLEKSFAQSLNKQELTALLYNETKKYSLTLNKLSFASINKEGALSSMPIEIICEGTDNNLLTFLEKLNSDSCYKFTVDSSSLTYTDDKVSGNIKLTAYAYNPQEDVPVE
jgi:Tfp pilus assembly protein PilO